ncbi:hypothetical protein M8J76_002833 [Diaphorina citri]|nr:hypothetical protein M8J76_002833 [Diaphorina citri]
MCNGDCFLLCFTIRAGSAIMSSIFLFLGLLGCLLVPFLPYSCNDVQLILIMIYMLLLVAGFGTALSGTLTYSKSSQGLGLFIASIAFFYWLWLTVNTLIYFPRDLSSEYCLGHKCGESHWLVPRNWDINDYSDLDKVNLLLERYFTDQYFDDYFNLEKKPKFPDYQMPGKYIGELASGSKDVLDNIRQLPPVKGEKIYYPGKKHSMDFEQELMDSAAGRRFKKKKTKGRRTTTTTTTTTIGNQPRNLPASALEEGQEWSKHNGTGMSNVSTTGHVEVEEDWLKIADDILERGKRESAELPETCNEPWHNDMRSLHPADPRLYQHFGPLDQMYPENSGNFLFTFNRPFSIVYAVLYALLFICALVTLSHNYRSCAEEPLEPLDCIRCEPSIADYEGKYAE